MIPLASKPNVNAPTGNFPMGEVRNNPGDNSGTPCNETLHGDWSQFFDGLMLNGGVSPNGVLDQGPSPPATGVRPDTSYQLLNALWNLIELVANGLISAAVAIVNTAIGNETTRATAAEKAIAVGWIQTTPSVSANGGGTISIGGNNLISYCVLQPSAVAKRTMIISWDFDVTQLTSTVSSINVSIPLGGAVIGNEFCGGNICQVGAIGDIGKITATPSLAHITITGSAAFTGTQNVFGQITIEIA